MVLINNNEFMDYLEYLKKLFNIKTPEKEVLPAWYKPFENTHLIIAKKMADMYLQEEQGKFKLAKLLEYKTRAMAGKTYFGDKGKECEYCGNTGYIQVEMPYRDTYTITCKRCVCPVGASIPGYVKRVTADELKDLDPNGKIIRRWNLHNYNDNPFESTSNSLIQAIKNIRQ